MTRPVILPPAIFVDPAQHPEADRVRAWQTHVDAGRIGGNPPMPADVLARLRATEALFRSLRTPGLAPEHGA